VQPDFPPFLRPGMPCLQLRLMARVRCILNGNNLFGCLDRCPFFFFGLGRFTGWSRDRYPESSSYDGFSFPPLSFFLNIFYAPVLLFTDTTSAPKFLGFTPRISTFTYLFFFFFLSPSHWSPVHLTSSLIVPFPTQTTQMPR